MNLRTLIQLILSLFLLPHLLFAQAATDSLTGNEMDFWVGEWDLEWTINGEQGKGSNSIKKTLDGSVIQEHFIGIEGPYAGYKGESYTTFNPQAGSYFQTWVDNQGGYLDFTFDSEGDRYMFVREAETNQGPVKTRMVFYDIEPNSLTWDWQRYDDASQTWTLQWRIFYTRKEKIEDLSINQFDWIVGRWKNSNENSVEVWKFSDDHSMLEGYNATFSVDHSDSTITERMHIQQKDGKFVFIAHPTANDASVEFPIISAMDNNFVSFNPNHDFPQRIEYYRISADQLVAIIKNREKSNRFEFVKQQ